MRKTTILLCLTLLFVGHKNFAQKVDLDKFFFPVSYQYLPKINIPIEERNYGVRVKLGSDFKIYADESSLYENVNIAGWSKVETKQTVGVDVELSEFGFRTLLPRSETTENKDKDGKVTSKSTTYWMDVHYKALGHCSINGPKPPDRKSKKEEVVVDKKEEAKPTNRFLVNAVKEEVKTNNPSDGYGFSLDEIYIHSTPKRSSAAAAKADYVDQKEEIFSASLKKYVSTSVASVSNTLNINYGFRQASENEFMWILDSKDHPEYQTQQEAIMAIKELFKTMDANKSTENLASNLKPLIEYLESLKTKYAGNDKRNTKMRYSAFFNLSKIYYYLDMPEKAKIEAEGLIANDYDESDGKSLEIIIIKNI